jgi:predicted aconitase with swiveling domain
MSEKIILKGHKGIGGVAEGEAIVTRNALSYIFDVGGIWDTPMSAKVTNKINMPDIYGLDLANKVLVFPTGRGGIFSSAMLLGVAHRGIGPKAMINVKTHPVFAYASVVLNIPTVDGFEKDPTTVVKTGDWIKVDAPNGIIEVTRKDDRKK